MSDSRMVAKVHRDVITLLRQRGGKRIGRSTVATATTDMAGLTKAVAEIYPVGTKGSGKKA